MGLLVLLLFTLAGLAAAASAAGGATRPAREAKHVAIIGAGAAGSSAAYHLRKFAEQEGLLIDVTIFEKTDHIGGRTITVNAFNDPELPIEQGASIFIKDNHIMYNATQAFNLSLTQFQSLDATDYTAIWDGNDIVFRSEEGNPWWWDAAKLFFKYGLAPYRAVQLVKGAVGTFLKLYEEPYFPFWSLTERAFELGLLRLTGITGEQHLQDNKINADFVREVMQPASRVNYASNMAFIHGLEAMVSFATDGAMAVDGGNFQIFEKFVLESGAIFRPNTTVTSIGFEKDSKHSSTVPKYVLSTKSHDGSKETRTNQSPTAFDNVIIASPWQFSGIEAANDVFRHTIDAIPYMKLHVTLFASRFRLQASYFGLDPASRAPSNVYTTLGKDETPQQGAAGVGRTGLYSISTLKKVVNPATREKEFLYKIFSPKPVNATLLSALLGTDVPSSIVTSSADIASDAPISWYRPHWFYSYPIELPRVTFQDPVVGRGLYYTSGIESFISTMETSALMGMNVARLIADDFAGITRRNGRAASPLTPEQETPREDFWDSVDNEMGASMDMTGADEL